MLTLYENPGWGSAIVEAQLDAYALAYRREEVGDLYDDAAARERFLAVNPLGQVPALRLASGEVMTESAAMTLYLADLAGSEALVPGPGAAERAGFLRWLIYLVAAVYPTFTFGDVPERFVPEAVVEDYVARVQAVRMGCYRQMEAEAARRGGPWFLGGRMTAIDVYLMVMVHWRPRQAWFRAECPTLASIAERAAALPEFAPAMARNFG